MVFIFIEYVDLRSKDGTGAGGQYAPGDSKHGAPGEDESHAGDLGNIVAVNAGTARVDKMAEGLQLQSVLGRSIVVHAKADDFVSQPSGDTGARVALGVIGVAGSAAENQEGDVSQMSFPEQFWAYLEKQKYRETWSRWPANATGFTEGKSPHGAFLKVYVNRAMLADPSIPPMKSIVPSCRELRSLRQRR